MLNLRLVKLFAAVLLFQHFAAHAQTVTIVGTMSLGNANLVNNASNVNMKGGTFRTTGSGAGNSETVGTLTLSANSTIALGTGSHNLILQRVMAHHGQAERFYASPVGQVGLMVPQEQRVRSFQVPAPNYLQVN